MEGRERQGRVGKGEEEIGGNGSTKLNFGSFRLSDLIPPILERYSESDVF